VHALAVRADDDEVADRDVGADVADAQRLLVEIDQDAAPPAIESTDPAGRMGRIGGRRSEEIGGPPESIVMWLRDGATVPVDRCPDRPMSWRRMGSRMSRGPRVGHDLLFRIHPRHPPAT